MLHNDTIPFLTELRQNNNREWFEQNRHRYEKVRNQAMHFATMALSSLQRIDRTLEMVQPKECLFRINRDVRFSHDKRPYKTHLGMIFTPQRRFAEHAGYYLHIEPDGCFIGGGIYMPPSAILKQIRAEIAENYQELTSIMANDSLNQLFGGFDREEGLFLKKAPQGYNENHPAIEWLKLKSYTVSRDFSPDIITTDDFFSFVIQHFTAIKPLNDFINRCFQW